MNLADSLATHIASLLSLTLGQDLFIGQAPSSIKVADDIWWIVDNGGGIVQKNATGESQKSYQFNIFGRNRNYETLKDSIATLEEDLNCDDCTQLSGYDTIDIEATSFAIDNDLDAEDRKLGLLQVTITTYKEC